jgi:hypothetical protein
MLEIIDDSNDQMMEWEHPDGSTFWEWINQHD